MTVLYTPRLIIVFDSGKINCGNCSSASEQTVLDIKTAAAYPSAL